ncbi:transposase [Paenibacillus aestuarii]|uniref:Transposase n=1 Tax=Paenibacillus aestuarii TaxID=516965 RepID=A0ABW0K2B9_9BACL|nr:transposase [Paenibacillus aestuarii]
MSLFIVLLVIMVPMFMMAIAWLIPVWRAIFDGAAVICAYIFGSISALAIYQILRDDTVFMTNIHSVFQNMIFLTAGSYLGSYMIYLLAWHTLKQLRNE